MGVLHKGVCYPDTQTAKKEFCSSFYTLWGGSSSTTISTGNGNGNANNSTTVTTQTFSSLECMATNFEIPTLPICRRLNGGSCVAGTTTYPTFTPCDHAGSQDLAYEWFLIALGLLVVVWGGKQLVRLFDFHHDRD